MLINSTKPINREWLAVSLLSAGARILETASMILPVKAIFILIKPEIVPEFWTQYGFNIAHLLLAIVGSTLIMFFSAKMLLVIAKQKARNLHLDIHHDQAEQMAQISTKISSSIMVMLVFCAIIGALDSYALLILAVLVAISQLHTPNSMRKTRDSIYRILGITQRTNRYRFISQLLFQLYFITMVTTVMLIKSHVTVVLLLVILVGRRFFQEYARLRIGLFQRQELKDGKLISE
jgi:hypothetical protein